MNGEMKCPSCGHIWNNFASRKDRATEDEVKAYCAELGLPDSDAEYLWCHWEAYGWRNGGAEIKNWKCVVRSWKVAGYLPSMRKPPEEKPRADWRRTLRKLYPGYGWIPTNFYDLPAEIKATVKEAMK